MNQKKVPLKKLQPLRKVLLTPPRVKRGGDGAPAVADMKEGEYLLHVLVETGKSIFLEGEATVDPLVKVTFMG